MCKILDYAHFYTMFIATIPSKKPAIFPIAVILLLYSLLDSGISSPDTIYNIAPAAKLKQKLIISLDISP